MQRLLLGILCAHISVMTALAGPFAPAAGQPGSTAIAGSDSRFIEWASQVVELDRGPINISNPGAGLATAGSESNALGPIDGTSIVSLGDGGSITLGFDRAITDGPGADFAVFENGFSDTFLELAFVEVSSNGIDFFRFDATSLTPTDAQVGSFGLLDPTNLDNLAGKYRGGYGTPFDLSELAGVSALLDVTDVRFVRIVDVVGSIDPLYATFDAGGRIVNDPWPTAFASGGFDLDGVGVINAVPEPGAMTLLATVAGIATVMQWRRRRLR